MLLSMDVYSIFLVIKTQYKIFNEVIKILPSIA